MSDETERAYVAAAETLANTRSLIANNEADADTILWAMARHGIAVWQLGQYGYGDTWFCTLSSKAAWGDVFHKAEHRASMLDAIMEAARVWSKTR